ncbi:hypothetical protein K2P97_07320 [bacterium]|nr:hypothetical protein [bacterium]
MKNLLSKSLLCGVLASTFLIVNCQKAPNRAVKAEVTPPAKLTAVKSAACSEGAVKESAEAQKLNDALDTIMKALKDKPKLEQTEIDNLNKAINDYAAQVKKLIAAIKLIEVGDKKEAAEACTSGKDTYNIVALQGHVAQKGKEVKAKTGVDNDATKEQPVQAEEALTDGLVLKIKKELADFLSDVKNIRGQNSAIVAGAILSGDAAAAALKDVNVTACALMSENVVAVAADAAMTVLTTTAVEQDAATKRNFSRVAVEVQVATGTHGLILSCNIADKKEAKATVEMRKALGALAAKAEVQTQVQPTAPVTPVLPNSGDDSQAPSSDDTPVASGDSSVASGDSSTASGDQSKAAAQEGLDILNNAQARQ